MDRGAWQATGHGVSESETTERLYFHFDHKISFFSPKKRNKEMLIFPTIRPTANGSQDFLTFVCVFYVTPSPQGRLSLSLTGCFYPGLI